MLTEKMKKVKLIVTRDDFESVLQELLKLGCIEVTVPDEFLNNPELRDQVLRIVVELDDFQTNQSSITLLGTQYTFLLTGWITARSEPEFAEKLSNYVCAWELDTPSPDDPEDIPVKLRWPKIFGFFYTGNGKMFEPLRLTAADS